MRLRSLVLLAIPLALGGCGRDGSRRRQPAVRIDGVRTDGDRGLLLTFLGGPPPTDATDPCAKSYRPEVVESAGRVVITIRTLPPTALLPREFFCTSIGYVRTASVRLDRPLGNRALVDGATGLQRSPFDGRTLLTARVLPDGWDLREEGPAGFDTPEPSARWRRRFGPPAVPPSGGRCADTVTPVTISQSPDPGTPGAGDVDVRGTRGTVVHDDAGAATLRWAENGQTIEVAETPACVGTPLGNVDLLRRIAEGLA